MTEQAPPPGWQPGQDNPKAAAKAYAKATRPWYKKKRFIIPIALVAIIAIATATSGGGSDGGNNKNADPQTTSSPNKSANDKPAADEGTKPSLTLPKQNGDWRLDSLQLKDDGIGDFAGVARITYTGEDTDGGNNLFTITVFDKSGKDVIATLNGAANSVKPGQTVTTQMIGTDKYQSGKFPFTFQNDL